MAAIAMLVVSVEPAGSAVVGPAHATGAIVAVRGAALADGETVTLNDGASAPVTLEFNSTGGVAPGNIAIAAGAGDSATLIASRVRTAVNGSTLAITATGAGPLVLLTNDQSGSTANVAINETVSDVDFFVTGMSGGTDNTSPTCNDVQLASTPHDQSRGGYANCQDADGDALTYEKAGVNAAHGTATVNPDGAISYTPDAAYVGTDTFHYRASDAYGGTSGIQAVTVEITNAAPVCSAVAEQAVAHDTPKSITLNCTDAENDSYTLALGATQPTKGAVTFTQPTHIVTYAPAAGASGPDSFDVVATDGVSDSSAVRVSVMIAVSDKTSGSPTSTNESETPTSGAAATPTPSTSPTQTPAPLQALAGRAVAALTKAARRVDAKKGLVLSTFNPADCPHGCTIAVTLKSSLGQRIGAARLVVPAGGKLKLKFNRAGQKVLRKGKRVKAAATFSLKDAATGATEVVTKKVTLQPTKH